MEGNIVVRSKIKEYCPEMSVSSGFGDALNEKVVALIKEALERAKANGRKTVMEKDL